MVWALWHLPLFMMVGTSYHELAISFVGFLLGMMAVSVLFTWLHNNTAGSIWTAIFFHWLYTYSAQVVASGVTRSGLYNWLGYVPYISIAIIVVLIWKPQTLQQIPTNHKSNERPISAYIGHVRAIVRAFGEYAPTRGFGVWWICPPCLSGCGQRQPLGSGRVCNCTWSCF